MIRYHGTPITPDAAASHILKGRHGLVSFGHPQQVGLVAEVCQSFVLDNGAFTAWKGGETPDWDEYAEWVQEWMYHPGFDWFLIPDVIDGEEQHNIDLINEFVAKFPDHRNRMVPVWHLHESLNHLNGLSHMFDRVAFGSSGEFAQLKTERWEERMDEAFNTICDDKGRPRVRVHGLRMMDPTIFSRYPFASVDSCNVARNIGIDKAWENFKYGGALSKGTRGVVMADRCESHASATVWVPNRETQYKMLFG